MGPHPRRLRRSPGSALTPWLRTAGFVLASIAWSVLAEPPTPTAVVDSLHRALVGQSGVVEYPARHQALDGPVRDSHHLDAIARLVAGRHWRQWEPAHQERFRQRFEALTVALYAGRFHGFQGDPFNVLEERPAARGNVEVLVDFDPGEASTPLRFEYLLSDVDGRWRIVNVRVDGVSDIALRRAETARLLAEVGFEGVLQAMQDEIDRLARGEVADPH